MSKPLTRSRSKDFSTKLSLAQLLSKLYTNSIMDKTIGNYFVLHGHNIKFDNKSYCNTNFITLILRHKV